MTKRGAVALAGVVLLLQSAAVSAQLVEQTPAPYADGQQLVVRSAILDRDFVVDVTPPVGPPPRSGLYPAVYALDGGHHVAGVDAEQLERAHRMAPAFVVAVGYREGEHDLRVHDLLFHRFTQDDGSCAGGGGAAFERFLVTELRPLLQARYPLDPARAVLAGHSYAGLFAANVLARSPGDFAAYMIASPSVWADPDVVQRLRRVGGRRPVYLAVGENETPRMLAGEDAIAHALAHTRLRLKAEVLAGRDHLTDYQPALAAALPFLLPPECQQSQKLRSTGAAPAA